MIKNSIIIILITALAATGFYILKYSQRSLAGLDDYGLSTEGVNHYLKSNKRVQRQPGLKQKLLKTLIEQNALAEVIVKEGKQDWSTANVAIKAKRNDMIVRQYFENFSTAAMSDADVEQYYKDNLQRFTQSQLKVAHILIRTHPKLGKKILDEKRSKAETALKQLKDGAEFSALVKTHSEDVLTVEKHGVIGWIDNGPRHQALYLAATSLKAGDIVDTLIVTPKGLHIVKLLEAPKNNITPLAEAAEKIRYQLGYRGKMEERARLRKIALDRINKDMKQFGLPGK